MTTDALVRIAAVVAAAALVAAPYWPHIAGLVAQAAEAARAHTATLGRIAAAGLIVAAAWGTLPLPNLPGVFEVPAVTVPAPSAEMQRLVEPVRVALASVPADKRQLWAATWAKAALVVEAEGATTVAVFTDTPSLRLLTTVALEVAWRRLGDMPPGSVDGLREAVEAAMRSALGLDAVPVTPHVRASYAEVAKAIAWAGTR
jgi:hypothetical protein